MATRQNSGTETRSASLPFITLGLSAVALLATSCVPYQVQEGPAGIQNPPQQRYGQRADGGESPSGTTGRRLEAQQEQAAPRQQQRPPQNQNRTPSPSEELVEAVDSELGQVTPTEITPPIEQPVVETPTPPTPPPAPPTEQYSFAKPVEGRPGTVYSPYAPGKQVDVSGIPPGTKVTDPHTGKVFLVP